MKRKLTTSFVRNAKKPDDKKSEIIWDDQITGLGLRIYEDNKKSFVFDYRYRGQRKRKVLGKYPEVSLELCRKIAFQKCAILASGKDPFQQSEYENFTIKDLGVRYIEYAHNNKAQKSARDDRNRINNKLIKHLGKKQLNAIHRTDIENYHSIVTQKHGSYEANRCLSLLSHMFTMAFRWNMVSGKFVNPAKGIKKNREKKRDVWLKAKDLASFLQSVSQEENIYIRSGILILIFCGLRHKELTRLTWSDIDFESKTMTIPNTKSGRPLLLPLTCELVKIFDELPRIVGQDNVFPWCEFPRSAWRRIKGRADLPTLKIHDLRRSCASILASGGASIKLIASVLNQSSLQITDQVYAHVDDDPRRQALEKMNTEVMKIYESIETENKTTGDAIDDWFEDL